MALICMALPVIQSSKLQSGCQYPAAADADEPGLGKTVQVREHVQHASRSVLDALFLQPCWFCGDDAVLLAADAGPHRVQPVPGSGGC